MFDLLKKANTKSSIISLCLIAMIMIITGCASRSVETDEYTGDNGNKEEKIITNIRISDDNEMMTVTVEGNQQLAYTSIKQDIPLGILFYFPKTKLKESLKERYAFDNSIVEAIEVSQITEEEDHSRILLLLKKDVPYKVIPDSLSINITFSKTIDISRETTDETGTGTEGSSLIPATRLESVRVSKYEKKIEINVNANGAINDYTSFVLDNPARIVFDIHNIESPHKKQKVVPVNTKLVKKVRHFGHPGKVRIVLDTKKAYLKNYAAHTVINGLVIIVGENKAVTASVSSTAKPVTKTEKSPIPKYDRKSVWVNRVDFRSEDTGKSTVIIGTTKPVEYKLKKVNSKLLKLDLMNAKIPKYRRRPLITTRFESAVNRITPVYKSSMKNNSMIAIELREDVHYTIEQKGDLLYIRFEASAIPPAQIDQADLPPWRKVLEQTDTDEKPTISRKSAAITPVETPGTSSTKKVPPSEIAVVDKAIAGPVKKPEDKLILNDYLKDDSKPNAGDGGVFEGIRTEDEIFDSLVSGRRTKKRYTGEKIALDFYDTDIKNVFRIIREISKKNFAIDKDVTGKVTLTLDKPVPWDQVLDLVLKMNNLGMTYEGDIIRIATLNTLTTEQQARQAKITAERKTQEVEEQLEPIETVYISINYSDATSDILPHVKPLITDKRGSVTVDTRNNQLIITDSAVKIEQIKEIVNKIDKVTPQVVIEARSVEATDDFSRDIGITWGVDLGPDGSVNTGWSGSTSGDVAMNFGQAAASRIGFNFTRLITDGTPFLINANIAAQEAKQNAKIITAPKIVTLDNVQAIIKQGYEYPYFEESSSGGTTVSFKKIELTLQVTPTVTPDDRILMKIDIKKDDVGKLVAGVPSIDTASANTELLVNDGDTIVIGGIMKTNIIEGTVGFPGLGSIPILGYLFKQSNKSKTSRELLIFITPKIIQLEQRKL